jgi:hypothetical protein
MKLAPSKGPSRVHVSISPEDGKRSRFRNDVFSYFLDYRMIGKVQKRSNS